MKSSLFLFNGSNKQQQTFSNKTIIMFAVVIVVILLGNIGKSHGEDPVAVQVSLLVEIKGWAQTVNRIQSENRGSKNRR